MIKRTYYFLLFYLIGIAIVVVGTYYITYSGFWMLNNLMLYCACLNLVRILGGIK